MSVYWLKDELTNAQNIEIEEQNHLLITRFANKTEKIYYPDPQEYIVSADIVQKAKNLGATIICYPTAWSQPTAEAKGYAKKLNIKLLKNAAFFAYLRRGGVLLPRK